MTSASHYVRDGGLEPSQHKAIALSIGLGKKRQPKGNKGGDLVRFFGDVERKRTDHQIRRRQNLTLPTEMAQESQVLGQALIVQDPFSTQIVPN